MIQLSNKIRYFMYPLSCDMRKSYDGLCGLIRNELKGQPNSGDAFVFFSRNHAQVKILMWEGDGYGLYAKRLEVGTFEVPACNVDRSATRLDDIALTHILRGILIESGKFRRRYTGEAMAVARAAN